MVATFPLAVLIPLWYMWLVGFYMYLCVDKTPPLTAVTPSLPATILRAIFEDLSKIAEREVLDTGNHIKYVKFARYQINKKIP